MMRVPVIQASEYAREIPVTIVGICIMAEWEVELYTSVGCSQVGPRVVVARFQTRAEAESFVLDTYGIARQATDGDLAHDGWWLS